MKETRVNRWRTVEGRMLDQEQITTFFFFFVERILKKLFVFIRPTSKPKFRLFRTQKIQNKEYWFDSGTSLTPTVSQ